MSISDVNFKEKLKKKLNIISDDIVVTNIFIISLVTTNNIIANMKFLVMTYLLSLVMTYWRQQKCC